MSPTGPHDLAALAQAAGAIAQRAARAILEVYEAPFTVTSKDDRSPLTAADLAANELIVGALRELTPQLPVLSEESSSVAWHERSRWSSYWLVDPLDGTREFVEKRGEFTVNIALIRDGVPVFGIVYAPTCEELYVTRGADHAAMARVAPREGAATLDEIGLTTIHTRAANVHALDALVSRSHATPETEAFLARYPIAARSSYGSSLKFCAIARGAADFYPRLGPTMAWDTAAGHAVLSAAGGCVMTLDGQALRYGTASGTLHNPHFVAWGTPHALAPST